MTSAPTGTVTITWGSGAKNKATVALKASHKGTLTYRLPKLAKGKWKAKLVYTPSNAVYRSAKKKVTVKVS